jgi:hypothetical protein
MCRLSLSPKTFILDWNIRFNIIPVMPGLVKKPLF